IGFTVLGNDLPATVALLRPLAAELGATIEQEEQVSKVSIVGTGMRTHTGVAERMFAALAAEDVNVKMITTGGIQISVLGDGNDGGRALRAVHQAFNLHESRPGAGLPPRAGNPSTQAAFPRRPGSATADNGSRDWSTLTQLLARMEDIVVSDVTLNT